MRINAIFAAGILAVWGQAALAAEAPKVFQGLFVPDKMVKAEIVTVVPPPEIDKYIAKVEAAARKDPEWFKQYAKDAPSGVPLPYHEKLGLTKDEYDKYLELWSKREFRSEAEVMLMLRETKPGEWVITATGPASRVSTLRYFSDKDVFKSPNGALERIEDIDASENSILGKWKGHEWRYLGKTDISTTKENIAIGKMANGKYGLIVYRIQEVSSQGSRLFDESMLIRFGLAGVAASPAPKKGGK
jgi:hypothetical protein